MEIQTITGREPKVSAALRMPLSLSQRLISVCEARKETFTQLALRALRAELERQEASGNGH